MKYMLVFLCLCGYSSLAAKLPSYIEVCKRKDTDLSKCILKNVEILRPKLTEKDGIKELGIPSIKPLFLPHAEIKLGQDFEAKLDNIYIHQIDGFIVDEFKVDLGEELSIDLKVRFPIVEARSDYKVNGKLLVLKLDGFGPGNINVTNLVGIVKGVGVKVNKNGKDHISIKSIDIKAEIGHMDIRLENLFPKNPELTENANNLLNENQVILAEDFAPLVINIIKEFITAILTNIFDRYSYDTLFPDS